MPNPVIGLIGASAASTAVQASSARSAASAQSAAADAGVAEQRRQFDTVRELLQPYVDIGNQSLGAQGALVGLGGAEAQRAAILGIEQSPQMAALTRTGEQGILSNASATGGLRGGNTQAALAQFRPQVLSQLIEAQYGRLGGLTQIGANAAAGVGTAAQSTGNNVSQLLQQQGAARAGGSLATGQAVAGGLGSIGSLFGQQLPTQGPLVPQDQSLFGRWGF